MLVHDSSVPPATLENAFKDANLTVSLVCQHDDGIDLAQRYEYDIIVLDLQTPNLTGHTFVRGIRDARVMTPVVVLSNSDEMQAKVKGLELGADDYVTKPIPVSELLARIQAIVRRSKGQSSSLVKIGELTLDLVAQTIFLRGVALRLTDMQYRVLELFCMRRGLLVTKSMILDHLYGGPNEPDAKSIDVLMHRLRKKIAQANEGEQIISTVWGAGYILIETEKS